MKDISKTTDGLPACVCASHSGNKHGACDELCKALALLSEPGMASLLQEVLENERQTRNIFAKLSGPIR